MSAVDWRSEQDYANFDKAEAADIAWEWLRRDSEYEQDFSSLTSAAQSRWGASPHSDRNGGCLFAADPEQAFDRQSIFWAPEALSTVLSLRQFGAASDAGQYALDLDQACLAANFAMGQMAGMALYRWQAQSIGFTCQQYLPKGHRFQSNCRSTPISTSVCRRRTDFGAPSKAAVLVHLLLRSLPSVAGASF